MKNYLKLPELAQRLDVSQQTARRMVKTGRIPAVFIGNAYRVSEADVAAYLENARVEPGGGPTLFETEPTPQLRIAEMFAAKPEARRRALEAASGAEVTAYLAELDRDLVRRAGAKADEDDTPETRRQLADYAFKLGQLHQEAEAHARVGALTA